MQSILDAINEWIKEILIGAINGNLSTMFGDVNEKVGTIAAEVGKTPQGWNASIFSMIQTLSENVIVPIAGLVITYVLCVELISMVGTEWEMPVVLAGMYGLRMSEIIGLRTTNIDLEKMQFGVVEQMPFKVPPGTKTITEMAPTKSNDRILPITEEALPYFLRQFDLIARQKALTEAGGGVYYDNKLFIAKPDGSPQRRDRMSANFGQLIRHLEMPHIRFHDLRHTAATNMHQLTGDFYTVGEILGHTLKGIGISLGISTNLEAVTAQYVDVRLERKQSVLQTYHKALQPKTTVTGKEAGQETSKKAKKKSNEMEL